MFRQSWCAGILAMALLAAPAPAQDQELTVRSGLSAFTGDLGGETNVGAFLGIQGEAQLFPAIGLELGYEGSANGFEGTGSGTLWRHNMGAMAKVGPVLDDRWVPFVGAGLGVSYVDPTGAADAGIYDEDIIMEVPLSAGLEYRFSGVTAGARATYRVLAGEDFAPGNVDEGDLFTAGLSLGGSF
ncbi:outer membrane protein [Pyxidicoccus trucidator]|uniref:outer membrane protein n=1 Tax=Pyxidicoccus trucidator TaxID=2709662 RepID=UPI0013DA1F66|nr:outer membrane beta-barrel protein [Pyxidicoccus trucidator]